MHEDGTFLLVLALPVETGNISDLDCLTYRDFRFCNLTFFAQERL